MYFNSVNMFLFRNKEVSESPELADGCVQQDLLLTTETQESNPNGRLNHTPPLDTTSDKKEDTTIQKDDPEQKSAKESKPESEDDKCNDEAEKESSKGDDEKCADDNEEKSVDVKIEKSNCKEDLDEKVKERKMRKMNHQN